MSFTIARALLLDGLYQVLDNKVFRILAIVAVLIVLIPLFVAFRPEELVLFFGYQRISYETVLTGIGPMFGFMPGTFDQLSPTELHRLMVDTYQDWIVSGIVGDIGMLICIAATAFFVPQMVEKGAADTLFSKPVSRLVLMIARYLTGILFVASLSFLLVFGTHAMLLLTAGTSDPAFLWSAVTLTYQFALLYSVTVLISVLLRNTVAAILLTLLFMTANSSIHCGWQIAEWTGSDEFREMTGQRIEVEVAEDGSTTTRELDEEEPEEEEGDEEDEDELGPIGRALKTTLYGLHYALPKTGDADAIVGKLRDQFSPPAAEAYSDTDVDFILEELPPGFTSIDAASLADAELFYPPVEEDESVIVAAAPDGSDAEARLVILKRFERQIPHGTSGRTRTETLRRAADAFEDWVTDDPVRGLTEDPKSVVVANGTTWRKSAREILFTCARGGEEWSVRTIIVKEGDWIFTIQLQTRAGWLDERTDVADSVGGRAFRFGSTSGSMSEMTGNPEEWFHAQLSWTGDWRYNIWFSLGSSIAFALACLFLGWIRLIRIDF